MEKKIELTTESGCKVRVMPHMVEDMLRFGATQVKKEVKQAPKELLKPIEKKVESVLPEMETTKSVAEPIPGTELTEVKVRKTPVRSKSKK